MTVYCQGLALIRGKEGRGRWDVVREWRETDVHKYTHTYIHKHICIHIQKRRIIRTVQAVLVAELVPAGVVRVVAVAHRVEVVALEQEDVLQHGGLVDHFPRDRVVLVAVDPAQDDGGAVDEEGPVLDLHRAVCYVFMCVYVCVRA